METDPDTLQKLIENAKPFQWFPQRTHEIFCLGAFRSMSGVALILFSLAPVEAESEDEFRVWSTLQSEGNPGDYGAITEAVRSMIARLFEVVPVKGYREINFYSNFNKSLYLAIISELNEEAKGNYRLRLKRTNLVDIDDTFFTLRNLIASKRLSVAGSEKLLISVMEDIPSMNPLNLAEIRASRGYAGELIFCLMHSIALWECWLIKHKLVLNRDKKQRYTN